jgi:hypothetical protein
MIELPRKIKEAIAANKLVVFAGSGLSTKFNLPNWNRLVADIINESDRHEYKSFLPILEAGLMTPLDVLDTMASEHNEIKRYISTHFNISNGDFSLHRKILDLSGQIVTTNYDNAFEMASENKIIPAVYTSDFNISEINKNNQPYIFKLHGSHTEPDHCIVYKEDYANLYDKNSAAKEKLKTIFTERLIIFVGFGFNDPDINLIFDTLDKAFRNNNKHYIITKEPHEFKKFKFVEPITISHYDEISTYFDSCLEYKNLNSAALVPIAKDFLVQGTNNHRIALLYPSPIDIQLDPELSKIQENFSAIDAHIYIGALNINSLGLLEDFDLIVIASQVFKGKLYIEDDNLKSNLLTAQEICSNIPNDNIPVIFITNEPVQIEGKQSKANVASLKRSVIKRFVFKALREGKWNFDNDIEVTTNAACKGGGRYTKGVAQVSSLYNNDRNLDIGRKCLTNVIGRIEEQSSLALRLLNIHKTNKLLNIKASGGTGKTTIIKKVAYELYNRGYYKAGVTFKSCESVKNIADFEEIIIDGFGLTNIINFKDYLTVNYGNNKIDSLIILDNFETVVTALNGTDLVEALDLLKFATDFANLVVTSRERLTMLDDFEDVFSLSPLITDDAYILFLKEYGPIDDETEIRILRDEILEDLLNNNPLAIKLVTKSRIRSVHISELRDQLKEHFFESINEDYTKVFKNNADLNIERTKSIYQSINYSYTTLSAKEKIAFELLSLFPDGISLNNFKRCFEKSNSSNSISDRELRVLRNKSLVEDYNGTLQLQPIIRRFADFQFHKRPVEIKQKYCLDAYLFNVFVLDLIKLVDNSQSTSEALRIYANYKNNLLSVLNYIPDIGISQNSLIDDKKYFLNYIYSIEGYIVNEKQIVELQSKLNSLKHYFSDLPNAATLIEVLDLNKTYYHKEFDSSYTELCKIHSVESMEQRIFDNEDYIEKRYKNIISNVHSMEGYTVQRIRSYVLNNDYSRFLSAHFFYLGIIDNISRRTEGFYYFEYELMFNRINHKALESYIGSLHPEQHLEIMQSTYTLSKIKQVDRKMIQRTVVTNPYTEGLKNLMFAFVEPLNKNKFKYFEKALINLFHIKYYYLEGLYYYCLLLKEMNHPEYTNKCVEGIELSAKFKYQYLAFLFANLDSTNKSDYSFSYDYYPIAGLEEYVHEHNRSWEKVFRENHV